jgi:hypothetical protein
LIERFKDASNHIKPTKEEAHMTQLRTHSNFNNSEKSSSTLSFLRRESSKQNNMLKR